MVKLVRGILFFQVSIQAMVMQLSVKVQLAEVFMDSAQINPEFTENQMVVLIVRLEFMELVFMVLRDILSVGGVL